MRRNYKQLNKLLKQNENLYRTRINMLDKMISPCGPNIYKEKILIPILSIVKTCKDEVNQEFILSCIIQVFNEEYNTIYY